MKCTSVVINMDIAKDKSGRLEDFEDDEFASRRCMLDGEFITNVCLKYITFNNIY